MELIQTSCAIAGLTCLMMALYSFKQLLRTSFRGCCHKS